MASRTYRDGRRVLAEDGAYVTSLPSLEALANSAFTALASQRCRIVLAKPHGGDLAEIARRMESGEIECVVDRVFPLDEVAQSHRYSQSERAQGKIVLRVAD